MTPEPRLLETAIRRWWVVLIAFAITTVLTVLWVSPKPSVYKSSGTYVVEPREGGDVRALEALLRPGAQINETYALIARSDAMKDAAEAQLTSIPPDANLKIDAEALTGTNALKISGEARDAKTAHALATAAGTAAIEHVESLQQPYTLVMLDAPELPSSPVNSRKTLTIVLGSLLGLMVGLGIAAIMDRIALLRRERQAMPVETFALDPVLSSSTSTLAARQTLAVPPPVPPAPRLGASQEYLDAATEPRDLRAAAIPPSAIPADPTRSNDVISDATSHPSVQAELARAAHEGSTYSLGIFRVDPSSPGNGHGSNGHRDANGNGAKGRRVNGHASAGERSRRFEPLHAEALRNGLTLNQIDDGLFAVVLPDTSAVSASKLLSDWLTNAPSIDADNPDAGLLMSMTVVEYPGRPDAAPRIHAWMMTGVDGADSGSARADAREEHILAAARGTGFLALGSFFEVGVRFVIALMLARLLGASDYGLYVLAVSAATIFAGLAALGLDDAMTRYVAILSGRRDQMGLRGTVQVGVVVSTVMGVVLGGVMFVAAQPLADHLFDEPRLAQLLRLLAIVIPFLTLSNVLAGTARGFGRMDFVALAENVVMSVVRLVLLVIVVAAAQGGLNVTAAVIVFGISDVSATITLVALLQKYYPLKSMSEGDARRVAPEVFRFAFPLWLSGMLRQFRRNFETILLGATSAAASVGIYAIVGNITMVGHLCLLALFVAVKPTLARLHDVGDRDGLTHLYATATRWAYTVTLPFFLVIVLFREPILLVFGDSFATGSTALLILAFGEIVNAGTGVCGPVLDMTGHTKAKLFNAITMTALLIGGNAILIPRHGVIGAAIASLIGITVSNLLCLVEIWWFERLTPFDWTFVKPTVAALVALAGGAVVSSLFPPGGNAAAAAEGLVVGAIFVALLLVLGLPEDDRMVLRRTLTKANELLHRRRRSAAAGEANIVVVSAAGAAAGSSPEPRTGPIYIGGLDRSGKTSMAAFLTSHPDIAVPDIGSNMWTYFYGQFGELSKPANFERCLDAMLRYKHVLHLEPDADRIRREFLDGPRTYASLFSLFLDHWAERQGKPRWGVQTGLLERYADPIFAADPDTKVIHMVRDPRDRYEGSLSLWPDGRGRAGGATARWTYSCRLAQRHAGRYPENYLIVRFEDMVLRTEPTLRHVCAFLDVDFHPAMLHMPGAPARRERLASRSDVATTESPLSGEFIGRYRENVPREELAFIQLHARRLMRTYGYTTDPTGLSRAQWSRFVVVGWPNQALRMVAWRGVEAVQQRLPAYAGRKPDRRTIVTASQ